MVFTSKDNHKGLCHVFQQKKMSLLIDFIIH